MLRMKLTLHIKNASKERQKFKEMTKILKQLMTKANDGNFVI